MAVMKNGEKYTVKVTYKPEYDATGELSLDSLTQTFSKVKETATNDQLYDFAHKLMSLTAYANAPYRVDLVSTAELVAN